MPEKKTEALHDKLDEKLAEVKVETLVASLTEIKAEALMKTLAARLTHQEIETLGETVAYRYADALCGKLAHDLRMVHIYTVNETVALMKAQALADKGRNTSPSRDRRTWQQTRTFEGLGSSRHTGRQTSRGGGSDT